MGRFAVSTKHDQSAVAWIATLLSLFYTTLSLAARYYLKSGTVSLDDAAIVTAQILAFAQYGTTFYGISQGLSKDLSLLDQSHRSHSANAFEASQVLYVLALAASKISVAMLIDRIFSGSDYKHESLVSRVLMAVIAVWGIGSAIAVSAGCDAEQILPQHGGALCAGSSTRWLVITIFDCFTELCMVVIPAYFLKSLQMSIGNKMTAGLAFGFRLGCIPFSVLRYTSYTSAIDNDSTGTAFSTVLSWQQATLCYSLIAATVPLSRNLFKRFETGNVVLNQTGTYSTQNRPFDSMKSDASKSKSRDRDGVAGGSGKFWSNPRSTYSTAVYHEEAAKHARTGSQDMIIWREDQVDVHVSSSEGLG